jgi:hypothetical protein
VVAIAFQLPVIPTVSIKRSECRQWVAPCALTGCRYHLGPRARKQPCALNIADEKALESKKIGDRLGLTDERVRQIEIEALTKVAPELQRLGILPEGDVHEIVERLLGKKDDGEKSKVRTKKPNPNQGNLF